MSEDKLTSDEVPHKFAEWLLAMGCPPENVPAVDKVAEMCRGQYYMVWRSLMEKVEAKNIIRNKRLQVFCDDVKKYKKKNIFNERVTNMVVPEELTLWNQHTQVMQMVADAEVRVTKEKENLHQLMDKVSSKLSHRNLSYKRLQDTQRRAQLLHRVADELRDKKANLKETKIIADSLCGLNEAVDLESKLDKCMQVLSDYNTGANAKSTGVALKSATKLAASSSIASNISECNDEEVISSLVKCRGDVVFKQLYEKRADLCSAIPATRHDKAVEDTKRVTPQSVLSHTAALHCTLALEAMKNRLNIKRTRNHLVTIVNELNSYLTGEACELLVSRCERTRSEARLASMRASCEEIASKTGIFATGSHQAPNSGAIKQIHSIDKSIEFKRDELKRLIASAATVERKVQNVKDCLTSLFNSFHYDGEDRFGGQSSLPLESVSTLRQFYEEKSQKRKNKVELSIDLDASENYSFSDPASTENGSTSFVVELKLYLKNFNLEDNRKLVLENGNKIWVFETIQSSLNQMHSKWLNDGITTSFLCPSGDLKHNLLRIATQIEKKAELDDMVRALEAGTKKNNTDFNITQITDEEQKTLDKIKKRLNENLLNLQKTRKTLDIGMENLRLWSDNDMKKFISINRLVDGKSYKQYERIYLECLQI